MQLSKTPKITAALAAATCSLLGQQAVAQETPDPDAWKFDTAILYYGETDRVQLTEAVLQATKSFSDDSIFTGKLVVDALTGASATGAVAQPYVQTYSRPSGKGAYTIGANETPLDDTFRDTRVQASANWQQPFATDYRYNVGGNISKEYDYLSLGLSGSLERDFNQRNTTVSGGLSYQFDSIDPVGGAPIGLASMNDYNNEGELFGNEGTRLGGSQSKDTIDVLVGVTQVINRNLLMQFNYGLSQVDGYLTDPYKLLSVVDGSGYTQDVVYENRPDSRTRHTLYWQTKYASDFGIADVSYRFATDDWEIDSHTIDSRFRYMLGDGSYIQPHFRYYQQSAADFYRPFLNQADALPMYASADYRVGEMIAYTVGFKYGQKMDNGQEWAFRLEYYQQDPKNAGFDAPGVLQDQDLYPSVKAIIAQVNYSF